MMTQFTVGFSRTINLGNFESCRVEASVTIVVEDDGAAYAEQRELAQLELRKLLEDTYRNQFESRKK